MSRRFLATMMTLVLLAFGIAGCGGSGTTGGSTNQGAQNQGGQAPAKRYKVFFANYSEVHANSVAVRKSLQEAAQKAGNIDLIVADNQSKPEQAVINADNAISQKVDLYIGYNPADVNAGIAKKMKDAGIKVLAVQFPIGDAPLYAIDNPEIGRVGGDELGKWGAANWKGQKVVSVFHNLLAGGDALLKRAKAAEDALRKHFPDIKITTLDTQAKADVVRNNMADFLTANPNTKVLAWVHLDDMALGAKAAAEAAGRADDVRIVSVGGDSAIWGELRKQNSPIVGSVAIFPEKWGAEIIPLVQKILKGEQVPAHTIPPMATLTNANINQYYPK